MCALFKTSIEMMFVRYLSWNVDFIPIKCFKWFNLLIVSIFNHFTNSVCCFYKYFFHLILYLLKCIKLFFICYILPFSFQIRSPLVRIKKFIGHWRTFIDSHVCFSKGNLSFTSMQLDYTWFIDYRSVHLKTWMIIFFQYYTFFQKILSSAKN